MHRQSPCGTTACHSLTRQLGPSRFLVRCCGFGRGVEWSGWIMALPQLRGAAAALALGCSFGQSSAASDTTLVRHQLSTRKACSRESVYAIMHYVLPAGARRHFGGAGQAALAKRTSRARDENQALDGRSVRFADAPRGRFARRSFSCGLCHAPLAFLVVLCASFVIAAQMSLARRRRTAVAASRVGRSYGQSWPTADAISRTRAMITRANWANCFRAVFVLGGSKRCSFHCSAGGFGDGIERRSRLLGLGGRAGRVGWRLVRFLALACWFSVAVGRIGFALFSTLATQRCLIFARKLAIGSGPFLEQAAAVCDRTASHTLFPHVFHRLSTLSVAQKFSSLPSPPEAQGRKAGDRWP